MSFNDELRIPPLTIEDFGGGINTYFNPANIDDNQLVECVNFLLKGNNLRTRHGVTNKSSNSAKTSRITSIAQLVDEVNGTAIIVTSGSSVFRLSGGTLTDITGGASLPSDTLFQWKQFHDTNLGSILIGATRGTSPQLNPIKVPDSVSNIALLGGSPPEARYIEVANDRVWIIPDDDPTDVYASQLGDAENWTTTGTPPGLAVILPFSTRGPLKGLYHYDDRMLVFETLQTHSIDWPRDRTINNDEREFQYNKLSAMVGCSSIRSCVEAVQDLFWLSPYGVVSYRALTQVNNTNVDQAIISKNVTALEGIDPTYDNACAVSIPHLDVAIWSVDTDGDGVNDKCFVLDYSRLVAGTGTAAWLEWDGKVIGECYEVIQVSGGRPQVYIGSEVDATPEAYVFAYDEDVETDDGEDIYAWLLTKAYDFGSPESRKELYRFATTLMGIGNTSSATVSVRFDQLLEKQKDWTYTFPDLSVAYDDLVYPWDYNGTYGADNLEQNFTQKFNMISSFGRLFRQVQLKIAKVATGAVGMLVRSFTLEVDEVGLELTDSDDITVS